ncbi:gliding motility-associated C-terminal domain-containing protein [Flavobacterium branchiicola]|uniref:Gliding motility-associated C-terminal domain-containing protein n=1 Tax=Flavobacterium branchiicola TaxID=1114875 RepID=A0ABV9PAK0_9FLAO|nr:gliding motility-associated C-terminal domain-containing protein [Flavobacterium branchiicola]MBS7253610.1 gliding motility-associated C-terminal domain-containing protein [Flavobacterium branchiicola]
MKNRFPFIKITTIFSIAFCGSVGHVQAQLLNPDQIKVAPGTIMSVHFDFKNAATGEFINDGQVHIFNHWTNDGKVDFTPSQQGTTYFTGKEEQIIDGDPSSLHSRLQNVVFDNNTAASPFILATDISVSGNAAFKQGIVDADSFNGKVIFDTNAAHSNTSNASFVDGRVSKIGTAGFEYPVGDANYYRPSIHANSGDNGDIYTSHYFLQDSDSAYPHSSKQENIQLIDNKEYWEITKDNGQTNIVLSLTLNPDTTPSYIYDNIVGTHIQIVRWDLASGKWISEGGVTDAGQTMVTAQVSDYGIFTLARVTKVDEEEDDLIVYNAVSPNGDGKNDYFHIKNIENYPDNTVEIYNRWGVMVFETHGYNGNDRVFRGFSDGRVTVNRGAGLPTGTYFYILKYKTKKGMKDKSGYLYINMDN